MLAGYLPTMWTEVTGVLGWRVISFPGNVHSSILDPHKTPGYSECGWVRFHCAFLFLLLFYIYLLTFVGGVSVGGSGDNLLVFVLSFHHVSPRVQTQVIWLDYIHLLPTES